MEYLEIKGTIKVNPDYPCAVKSLASELSDFKFADDNGFIVITLCGCELGIEGEGHINCPKLICTIVDRLCEYLDDQSTIDIYRDTDLQTLQISFLIENRLLAITGEQDLLARSA